MSEPVPEPFTDTSNLFTCLSCSVAFLSAEDQRLHYRSDHHRYNMKRRVAGLPPLSAALFNEKVLERKAETAIISSLKGSVCEACRKTYTTENAYRSHLNSKKHKEAELKALTPPENQPKHPTPPPEAPSSVHDNQPQEEEEKPEMTLEERIAAARSRLSPTSCLFCSIPSSPFPTISENLTHMSATHSFFIPDAEYLTDLPGLLNYLGEEIAAHHICIFCSGKGKDFRSLDAVRKHMLDKGHCKIAYDTELERLRISDFYDFTSSYPQDSIRTKRRKEVRDPTVDEWEDVDDDDDDEIDEIVDASDLDSDQSPENQLTYGDSYYELVLPSGARIGHRSMRRYYAQSFANPIGPKPSDPNSGAALVRRLIADKNSALVPTRGGFGAFGHGTDVVKARNTGEAREAGRHVREFRDQTRREQFKTKVAFRHNYQKHYRDPLLQ